MQCSEEKQMTVHGLASLGISNAHGRLAMPKADWAIGMAQYVWLLLLLLLLLFLLLLLLFFFFFLLWHKTGVMSWLYKQSSTASLKLQHLKKAGAFYCRFNVFFLLITYKLKNDLWYGKRDISASAAVSRCQNRKFKNKPIISRTVSGLKGVHVPVDKQDGGSMRPLCLKKWHKTQRLESHLAYTLSSRLLRISQFGKSFLFLRKNIYHRRTTLFSRI